MKKIDSLPKDRFARTNSETKASKPTLNRYSICKITSRPPTPLSSVLNDNFLISSSSLSCINGSKNDKSFRDNASCTSSTSSSSSCTISSTNSLNKINSRFDLCDPLTVSVDSYKYNRNNKQNRARRSISNIKNKDSYNETDGILILSPSPSPTLSPSTINTSNSSHSSPVELLHNSKRNCLFVRNLT